MKTREFTIKTENFDIDCSYDLEMNLVEDYLYEDLEVPEECIESLKIYDKFVNIKLSSSKQYFNDDWYVNLQRVG